jgi:hypothetical protein
MLSRKIILITFTLLWQLPAYSQHFAKNDFNTVDSAVNSAVTKDRLMKGLHTLLGKYMPSRSGVSLQFNRQLEGDCYHQRIAVRFYPNNFFINLLTRNDSIFLSTVYFTESSFAEGPGFREADNGVKAIHYNEAVVNSFLKERNFFYRSQKAIQEAAVELSGNDLYAMRCGYASSFTKEGKHINDLLEEADPLPEITAMLQNFSCEIQAFGVTAIEMLIKKGTPIDPLNSKLYRHIRQRNAPVISCSGCIVGGLLKLYDNK